MDTYVEIVKGGLRKGVGGVLSINSGVAYITLDIFLGDGESISIMLVDGDIEKFRQSFDIAEKEAIEKCHLEIEVL